MTVRVRPATEADLESIASLVTAAFHPDIDPISRNLFPPHLQPSDVPYGQAARPWRLARKTLAISEDRIKIMLAVDDALDSKIVGFALWEVPLKRQTDPITEIPHPEVQCDALDKEAFAELRRVTTADLKKHFGDRGTNDMWHLDYLGVDPQHHRRGIGRLLLEWGLQQADSEGKDCYLVATPLGRPLYQKTGFVDLDELPMFNVLHHSMIRRSAGRQ